MKALSVERLRQLLSYDEVTGIFFWRRLNRKRSWWEGQDAGTVTKMGYVNIGIDGAHYRAHRLAWAYIHGTFPDGEIDHRDNNPSNNAIGNLRLASSTEQKRNKRVQSNSRSGLKGAYYHSCRKGKKWRAQIKVGKSLVFLGYYETAEEAHAAYGRAAAEYFGEFARAA